MIAYQDFLHTLETRPPIPILKQAKTAIRLGHLPESLVEDKLSQSQFKPGQIVPQAETRPPNPLILQV